MPDGLLAPMMRANMEAIMKARMDMDQQICEMRPSATRVPQAPPGCGRRPPGSLGRVSGGGTSGRAPGDLTTSGAPESLLRSSTIGNSNEIR